MPSYPSACAVCSKCAAQLMWMRPRFLEISKDEQACSLSVYQYLSALAMCILFSSTGYVYPIQQHWLCVSYSAALVMCILFSSTGYVYPIQQLQEQMAAH